MVLSDSASNNQKRNVFGNMTLPSLQRDGMPTSKRQKKTHHGDTEARRKQFSNAKDRPPKLLPSGVFVLIRNPPNPHSSLCLRASVVKFFCLIKANSNHSARTNQRRSRLLQQAFRSRIVPASRALVRRRESRATRGSPSATIGPWATWNTHPRRSALRPTRLTEL